MQNQIATPAPTSRLNPTLWGAVGGAVLAGISVLSFRAPWKMALGLGVAGGGLAGFATARISRPQATPIADAVQVALVNDQPLSPGVEHTGFLRLSHANGQPVTADELAEVHTQKYHLLVVDSTLTDFHHLHPTPTHTPGLYAFHFTPRTGHDYVAWSDVVLTDGRTAQLRSTIVGTAPALQTPAPRAVTHGQVQHLHFALEQAAPLRAGEPNLLRLQLRDDAGKPITQLTDYLGAKAHCVGFSMQGKTFLHSHAMDISPEGVLEIPVTPPSAGPMRIYIQLQYEGQEITMPLGVTVYPGRGVASETPSPHHR